MKQLSFLFICIAVFLSQMGFAQNIKDIMNDDNLNYFEKVKEIDQNITNLKAGVDDPILKRYYRWRSFWDTRVGPDGNQKAYAKAWHDILLPENLPAILKVQGFPGNLQDHMRTSWMKIIKIIWGLLPA